MRGRESVELNFNLHSGLDSQLVQIEVKLSGGEILKAAFAKQQMDAINYHLSY